VPEYLHVYVSPPYERLKLACTNPATGDENAEIGRAAGETNASVACHRDSVAPHIELLLLGSDPQGLVSKPRHMLPQPP
jgi:hypothetical protein